jgi:two-component system CheB/CheR fusion protein
MRAGVVVLDQNLIVQIWNRKSEDLWGLRSEEVIGTQFLILNIGLPVDRLKQPIRDCLGTDGVNREIRVEARDRRGRTCNYEITCTPLKESDKSIGGVILLMEEEEERLKAESQAVPSPKNGPVLKPEKDGGSFSG